MASPYPASLSQALSASRNTDLSFLNNVGTSQESFEPVTKTIERVAGQFITEVKDAITSQNIQVTGDIANMSVEIIDDNKVHIMGNVQLLVLNYGIAGVKSNSKAPNSTFSYHEGRHIPLLPILGWIKFRGLEFRKPETMTDITYDNMTDDEKQKAVAYQVKNSIYNYGRKPVAVMEIPLENLKENLAKELTKNAIINAMGKLPLTIGVPAAYESDGTQIPNTGNAIPGLL